MHRAPLNFKILKDKTLKHIIIRLTYNVRLQLCHFMYNCVFVFAVIIRSTFAISARLSNIPRSALDIWHVKACSVVMVLQP